MSDGDRQREVLRYGAGGVLCHNQSDDGWSINCAEITQSVQQMGELGICAT